MIKLAVTRLLFWLVLITYCSVCNFPDSLNKNLMLHYSCTALNSSSVASSVLSCSMAFYLEEVMSCTRSVLLAVSGWVPRHVIGAVLVSLPAISVLSHFACSVDLPLQVNVCQRSVALKLVKIVKMNEVKRR